MISSNRRRFLGGCSASIAVALSGCSVGYPSANAEVESEMGDFVEYLKDKTSLTIVEVGDYEDATVPAYHLWVRQDTTENLHPIQIVPPYYSIAVEDGLINKSLVVTASRPGTPLVRFGMRYSRTVEYNSGELNPPEYYGGIDDSMEVLNT